MPKGVQRRFVKRFLHNRVSGRKLPFFGSVEATRRCNSRCSFCPIGNERQEFKKGEMTTEEFKKVFDQFADFDLIVTSFLGGEPTLRKDFAELGHYAREKGLITQAVTNGLTLADHTDEYTRAIDNLVVSLDTLDPQKYKEIRGVDKFDDVVEGIEAAVNVSKKNKCVVVLNTVICSANMSEIPDIVKYAKRIGAGGIMVDFATFHDYWTTMTDEHSTYDPKKMDWRRDSKGVQKLVRQLMAMKKEYPILTSRSYLKTFLTGDFDYTCHPYLFCCVNRLGEIAIPCWDSKITKFYSLLDGKSLREIWRMPEVVASRKAVKDCKSCYMHCIVEPSKVVGEPFHNLGDLMEWIGVMRKNGKAIMG
ncbi:MAG: radical SAM protein [Euryarchaeota archaeon]|nr:radical SAM protein [Euryarchaeota archaeon]